MSSTSQFTDAQLLGQSVVLLPRGSDAFDLDVVLDQKRRIVTLSEDQSTVTFPDGDTYAIPKNTKLTNSAGGTTTNSMRVETGTDLASTLDTSASFSANYAGVSASTSSQYSYSHSLSTAKVYGVMSVDHRSFFLELDYDGSPVVVNERLLAAVEELPDWKVDQTTFDQYMNFFNDWGTHVMESCVFGARYQLKVNNELTKTETKEKFELHVKAEYNGIADVSGDVSVKNSSDYKTYRKTRENQVYVRGGTDASRVELSTSQPDDNPEEYRKTFNEWAQTLNNSNTASLVNIRVDSIGNSLRKSGNPEYEPAARKLIDALGYISALRVIQGQISVESFGTTEQPEYTCSLHNVPGMQLKYISAGSGNLSPVDQEPTSLKLRLQANPTQSSEPDVIIPQSGTSAWVNVQVTTPQEASVVHLEKPTSKGWYSLVLDLQPGGPKVQSTVDDKQTTRDIPVDSLAISGTYGT
ncbi:hypothetical protein A7C99_4374 [Trichophyton rubrum]|uniref:MACPF domain-containing protein n=4 Tax=Trichophyton TaxID=5550 RepID=A0A178EW49_TRIRU|nr:Membrane attack complex component/perforin (MACPF) domain [Trichophyton rubrum]OAL64304.1 hypothetical protein A7C99_4374 [Trichophyton rubrum]OAL69742.1 hypothetical protein A7D00_6457 [Trichophyton violaceum]